MKLHSVKWFIFWKAKKTQKKTRLSVTSMNIVHSVWHYSEISLGISWWYLCGVSSWISVSYREDRAHMCCGVVSDCKKCTKRRDVFWLWDLWYTSLWKKTFVHYDDRFFVRYRSTRPQAIKLRQTVARHCRTATAFIIRCKKANLISVQKNTAVGKSPNIAKTRAPFQFHCTLYGLRDRIEHFHK